jgi:hypothetical protein
MINELLIDTHLQIPLEVVAEGIDSVSERSRCIVPSSDGQVEPGHKQA